ncbi:MAG: hypothetical protein GWO20_13505 [Candidatus Korarchaeota archaeon]|nr:hypothetical protein [Candidatus Korarchaeota archaeon]NIU84409.1 hypothetical protein [Candidatus Thorarchaeota archaeon]NIW14518.1 hypothetical protein [Candidatus Thorarchaeota archaeon]NIW52597.1 hypothetical protein [Candidatus Korarchaeota archaeon]
MRIDPNWFNTLPFRQAFGQVNELSSLNPDDLLIGVYGLLSGNLVIVGSVLTLLAMGKESKHTGVVGFLLMIARLGAFLIGLNNVEAFQEIVTTLEFLSGETYNHFFGNVNLGFGEVVWRLGNGFFLATLTTLLSVIASITPD